MKNMKKIISVCLVLSIIITNNMFNRHIVLADNVENISYDNEYTLSTNSEIDIEEAENLDNDEDDIANDVVDVSIDNETHNETSDLPLGDNIETEEVDKEVILNDENNNDSENINIESAGENKESVEANMFGSSIENVASKSEVIYFDEDIIYPTGAVYSNTDAPEVTDIDMINLDKKNLYGDSELPSSYDMRDYTNEETGLNFVPAIKNQAFGDCWTFSTIAMFETNLRKNGLIKNDDTSLSESCVSYFTYGLHDVNNDAAYTGEPGVQGYDRTKLTTSTFAKRGGNQYMSTLAASSYMGVVVEDENSQYANLAAITEEELKDFSIDPEYAYNKNGYVLKNAYYMNKNNLDAIKQAILDYGAVGMNYYGEGSYEQRKKFSHKNPNDDTDDSWYYWTDKNEYNHAIAIIGWDDSKSADCFYVDDGTEERNKVGSGPKNNGAWLCRNSWGKYSMSNEGYFWLSYEEPSLGSTMFAVEADVADRYKYNYHYDSTGITRTLGYAKLNKPKYANVFKVSDDYDQTLDAVNVCISSAQTEFDITIYTKDTEMENPEDGTKRVTKTVSKAFSGVYTIELDDKITLKKGTYYSIVVRGTASSDNYFTLFADAYDKGDWMSGYNYYNESALCQSYFTYLKTTKDYYAWRDINDGSKNYTNTKDLVTEGGKTYGRNLRIKGLTNILGDTKITFNKGEGEGTMKDQYVISGEDANIDLNTFTKTGYKFDKWVDSANNKYDDGGTINITSDIELTATFVPVTYTIIYNTNGGNVNPATVTKTYNTNVTLAEPTLTGHTFSNWYKEGDFKNVYDGTEDLSTTENDNVTIYAKYEPNIYNVTFETNGGTIKSGNIINYTYGVGAKLPTDVEGEDEHKTFYGWYENADFSGNVIREITTTDIGDKIYYAKYTLSYDITYVANNGTTDTYVQKAFEGEDTILKDIMFKRQGWTFNNWSADNGMTYKNKENIGVVTSNMTLTANWTKDPDKNTNTNNNNTVRDGGGSDSSGGSSGSSGPISVNINVNVNNNSNTNNKDISNNTISVTENNTTWSKDQLTGNWKLSINTPLTGTLSASNGFVQISTVVNGQVENHTYCFDANGNMLVGWVQTADKNWHYMDSNPSTLGMQIQNNWKNIDGKFYCFDSNGILFINTITPNNMPVDANGELIDPTGLFSIQLRMQGK